MYVSLKEKQQQQKNVCFVICVVHIISLEQYESDVLHIASALKHANCARQFYVLKRMWRKIFLHLFYCIYNKMVLGN